MTELTVKLHPIATDGLPDMDALTGRVAFIFDGCVVSGWPLLRDEHPETYDRVGVYEGEGTLWEANSDVGHGRPFYGVTHWLEFPTEIWELVRP